MWFLILVALPSAGRATPSIVQIVADDLGYNDLGYMNGGLTHTPHMDKLMEDGLRLESYYTYKVCSPSRASILTGRYPWGVGYYDMKGPLVLPTTYNILPSVLKGAGYSTHAIGKWNLGHELRPFTPTQRGFDTFFGYYAAAQVDVWYHGAPANECGTNAPGDIIMDLSNSTTEKLLPAEGLNGTYNHELFTAEAERLIHGHVARRRDGLLAADAPLYIYLAYHNVHSSVNVVGYGLQAPEASLAFYENTTLDTYKVAGAMLTELDAGVSRIIQALDDAGLLETSVVVFCSDNGGPLDHATNWPLRGGKHSMWEGGLRAVAWVYSPLLPKQSRGKQWHGMMHSSDWFPTLVEGVAGVMKPNTGGPRPLDGHNLWPVWLQGASADSPRTEVVHQVVNDYCQSVAPKGPTIRVGKYKLINGKPGVTDIVAWPSPSDKPVPFGLTGGTIEPGTDHARAGGVTNLEVGAQIECEPWCLFDLVADPSESKDLANDTAHADIVQHLAARLEKHAATGPDWAWPLQGDVEKAVKEEMCAEAIKTGFFEPIRDTPPEVDLDLIL